MQVPEKGLANFFAHFGALFVGTEERGYCY